MEAEDIKKSVEWYREKQSLYNLLAEKVTDIIEEVFEAKNINYASIACREKSMDSFKKKLESGVKFKAEEMQDLAGIRIVGYVKSDVDAMVKIIKTLFDVDEKRSIDKAEQLGTDKVGYLSMHFVAKLSKARIQLLEFQKFEGLHFEIQIRTILQHAWAEIQHDRNYKFSGILPQKLERRFSLLAGHLELADNEFDTIAKSIEKYSENVSDKTKAGQLDIPIDSTSLRQFFIEKFGDIPNMEHSFGPRDDLSPELISELKDMGIQTLQELNNIIPNGFKDLVLKHETDGNFAGLIRAILIIHDADSYFNKSWKHHWKRFSDANSVIYSVYDINTKQLAKKYDLEINMD